MRFLPLISFYDFIQVLHSAREIYTRDQYFSVEVTEFSKHLPQIGFKIATEHYQHGSFYENMVGVAL
jgi:hypothetical protein